MVQSMNPKFPAAIQILIGIISSIIIFKLKAFRVGKISKILYVTTNTKCSQKYKNDLKYILNYILKKLSNKKKLTYVSPSTPDEEISKFNI